MYQQNEYIVQALPGLHFHHIWSNSTHNSVLPPLEKSKIFMLHRARTGIASFANLISRSQKNEILVPSYNCGMEIDPFYEAGVRVVVYRVNEKAEIDLDDIKNKITSKTNAIYVTHYFGYLHDLEKINKICKQEDILLFEDCALSLLSQGRRLGAGESGDISVFSYSKSLPVPDGGVLVLNTDNKNWANWDPRRPSIKVIIRDTIPLLKSSLIQQLSAWFPRKTFNTLGKKVGDRISLRDTNVTYPGIPSDYYFNGSGVNRGMSTLSRLITRNIDFGEVITTRRNNFLRLLNELDQSEVFSFFYSKLSEGVCPLFFPILTNQRDSVCQQLRKSGVAAIPFWSGFHRDVEWDKFPDAVYLKKSVIALPIHQDINEKQITYMIDLMNNLQRLS